VSQGGFFRIRRAGALDHASFADRLVYWYGSHMKAAGTPLQRIIHGCIGLLSFGSLDPCVNLIFDDSDMSGGSRRWHFPFGRRSELLELAFLSAPLEWTAL
jgi:hypothetical protein